MIRNITIFLIAALGLSGCSNPQPESAEPTGTQFVFVKIPESIFPVERGEKYEDPLDRALQAAGVGEVTGGGSQMSEADEEGNRSIEWIGIDVDLTVFDRGMAVLKEELARLGAPEGTVLEFTRNDIRHSEPLR